MLQGNGTAQICRLQTTQDIFPHHQTVTDELIDNHCIMFKMKSDHLIRRIHFYLKMELLIQLQTSINIGQQQIQSHLACLPSCGQFLQLQIKSAECPLENNEAITSLNFYYLYIHQ